MSMLWLAVPDRDDDTRQRAVDALHDAGIEVTHAGPRPDTAVLSRDPVGIVMGVGFTLLTGGLASWTVYLGGWWWTAAVPLAVVAVLCAAGTTSAAQLKDRTTQRRVRA